LVLRGGLRGSVSYQARAAIGHSQPKAFRRFSSEWRGAVEQKKEPEQARKSAKKCQQERKCLRSGWRLESGRMVPIEPKDGTRAGVDTWWVSVKGLTPTPPSGPLKPSTGAAVRDYRNAVRDRSESLSAIDRNHRPHSPESAIKDQQFATAAAHLDAARRCAEGAAVAPMVRR
jgi:hypothetical protein